ncbi:hypothetical protein Tco_0865318 [Tanacetum coccineum]
MQSPFPQRTPKESSQTEGEHIKKDKSKKAMSSKDTEAESIESDFDDKTTHVPGSTVEFSSKKELKKFDFVTEGGEHVHLTKEQISAQKEIGEEAKAEAARREGEIRKEELIDLLGLEVVKKYYNDKLQYDKYSDKMQNRRAASRITNCDVLPRKGPITLKVYKEDVQVKLIPIQSQCSSPCQWRNNGRQDFVTIEDFRDFPNTMLYTVQDIFFILHQGPGLDDYARTFSSLLLAEIDKRNLNPLKQIRVIEQLRQ